MYCVNFTIRFLVHGDDGDDSLETPIIAIIYKQDISVKPLFGQKLLLSLPS